MNDLRPHFNYDISVMDRINQITNAPRQGVIKMIFPASVTDEVVKNALVDISNAGLCKFDDRNLHENSGIDQDLYYEVLVSCFDEYQLVVRELIISWDLIPLAAVYIPSKEEVGL